ncbi:uncharacterized protein K489DRAFT_255971 [Dissoconium aciculare CBS 342.82]|uniref:Uncharacterized protein n=1 Tax=Dissoconium aciculare CBS 342.82 TaxID=1314786 RepID=A0A6J3M2P1_9PEZI|nr:uncharacterized protein K489DRAFT_255971 [Dissoconium aciculare CBS 342.82]KAF1821769.1 hypothetical protein K489DRAFT_255971 [Dissoconium aciculare CBS 342.82]
MAPACGRGGQREFLFFSFMRVVSGGVRSEWNGMEWDGMDRCKSCEAGGGGGGGGGGVFGECRVLSLSPDFSLFSLFKQTDVPVMNGDTGIPPREEPHHRPLSSRAPLRCERRRFSAFVVDGRSRRDRGVCM